MRVRDHEATASTPLLNAAFGSSSRVTGGGAFSEASTASTSRPPRRSGSGASAAEDLRFWPRLAAVLRLLRPYPALSLAALSILDSLIVAQVGKVAGSFYRIVVDRDVSALLATLARASLLYAAAAAVFAASTWLAARLVLIWRAALTRHLHRAYCGGGGGDGGGRVLPLPPGYYRLHVANNAAVARRAQQQQQQQGAGGSGAADNPDQRIARDAAALCDALGAAARVAAAAPFRVAYYSWLTAGYVGWGGLAAVHAFFWAAAAAQKLVLAPVARLVAAQEAAEGDLRHAHARVREYALEAAQYSRQYSGNSTAAGARCSGGGALAAAAEEAALEGALAAALRVQGRLVLWRTAAAAAVRVTDYAGAALNYAVVAAAVFAGAAGQPGGADGGGADAQFVSNASFATLTLIYSFTELVDLSDTLASLAGYLARVGQLMEALPTPEGAAGGGAADGTGVEGGAAGLPPWQGAGAPPRASVDGCELRASELSRLLLAPTPLSCRGGAVALEASVHGLGADLAAEMAAIFPDAPLPTPGGAGPPLLAVITFQGAAGGVSLAPGGSSEDEAKAAAEMDRMLGCFLWWEASLSAALRAGGHWCDAADPRTGTALRGARGARWGEVAAAHALLGYERRDVGICPVVVHPSFGLGGYPVTVFTDAPLALVTAAMAATCDGPPPPALGGLLGLLPPLLSLHGLTVRTPDGRTAVIGLSLALPPGQHLLIAGPNGCGKSTLLRTLAGLHPAAGGGTALGGAAAFSPGSPGGGDGSSPGVMFLPQRPLAAPGRALWQQVAYPETSRPADERLLGLLRAVGLTHLLARCPGGTPAAAAADWGADLSPGELQRIAFARVLLSRPALAVMDEPVSAVGAEDAAALYGALHAAGVTCVSVGQDQPHLRAAHRVLLRLGGGGGRWELETLGPTAEAAAVSPPGSGQLVERLQGRY